jgi:hypothetical protein
MAVLSPICRRHRNAGGILAPLGRLVARTACIPPPRPPQRPDEVKLGEFFGLRAFDDIQTGVWDSDRSPNYSGAARQAPAARRHNLKRVGPSTRDM